MPFKYPGSGSPFALFSSDAGEETSFNEASSPDGRRGLASQQPVDPPLEAALDLPDIIRRTHQSIDQASTLTIREGLRGRHMLDTTRGIR